MAENFFKKATNKAKEAFKGLTEKLKTKKVFDETANSILALDSPNDLKEAYNSLCMNIIHLCSDDGVKKIAVTSSEYGEGKSELAVNLAISLSHNLIDKKILLIDADMHNPHIKSFIPDDLCNKDTANGLSDYLSSKDNEPSFIESKISNLSLLFSGSETANKSGLLNSDRMNELLSTCEEKFDYVIIDTPPTGYASDTLLLSPRVTGYVVSTKAKVSTVPMLNAATEALESVDAKVLGVVLAM